MYDGDQVIAALARKADKSPLFAAKLLKAINSTSIAKYREKFAHLTDKELAESAAQINKRENARMQAVRISID